MGMAASQARLLALTARIHDVEAQGQAIQNAKLQLANNSDQAYTNYLEALDATTLTVKDWEGNIHTANFNTLCSINAVDTGVKYALKDSKNRLIVPRDIEEGYEQFLATGFSRDPYTFAMYMLNPDVLAEDTTDEVNGISYLENAENYTAETCGNSKIAEYQATMDQIILDAREVAGEELAPSISNIDDVYSNIHGSGDLFSDVQKEKFQELYDKYSEVENVYRNILYSQNAEAIFVKSGCEATDFDQTKFDYYVSMFSQIEASGACISINSFDGINGDAANDSEWLKNMISCGKITIDIVNTDNKTGKVSFNGTSTSSDTYVGLTNTTTIDKKALAKAEAEYERQLKEIDKKDKKYDLELSKLETERTALTTEYDSVKKVITDNIERTFGIFS